jgi:hypothetical protein
MALNIELSSDKLLRFNERAKLVGLSPEEFAQKVVELIVDTSDEEFEGWLETLEIFLDRDFTIRLKESINQAVRGQVTDWEEAKRELGIT